MSIYSEEYQQLLGEMARTYASNLSKAEPIMSKLIDELHELLRKNNCEVYIVLLTLASTMEDILKFMPGATEYLKKFEKGGEKTNDPSL